MPMLDLAGLNLRRVVTQERLSSGPETAGGPRRLLSLLVAEVARLTSSPRPDKADLRRHPALAGRLGRTDPHTAGMETPLARSVVFAGAALVGGSVVGGVVSVFAGVNTWRNAWTAEATLAAPWPMLLIQAGASVAAASPRRVPALAGPAVLGLSAAVAGISGFFDGQLGRSDLGRGYVGAQILYVAVAWATAVLAGARAREVASRP